MKKLLLGLLLATPLFASANSLVFTPNGGNFAIAGYDLSPNTTGNRNVGQWGSFSIAGAGGGTFSATYLGDESGFNNNYRQSLSLGFQVMDESNFGRTLTAQVFGPGLLSFGFATSGPSGYSGVFLNGDTATNPLGFAVLKELNGTGYYNNTTLGLFDYLIGFNDFYRGDADYDDYVVGINYTPNAVPLPSALPLMLTAIGLFGLGANRRRV
jgi:hypothetical protein